jgi:hypothetical protein
MQFLKSIFLLAACCVVVQAATITITEVRNSKTPTQVAFQYCEASAATITLAASPTGQLTTYTPNDINTSIFSNSNIDTDRASTIIGPNGCKTLVLGANWALQVATLHTLTLTAGSDSGSINFTTGIPGLGNSSAWLTPANPTNWGNYPWPVFDWTNQGDQYIDPITGMMIRRVTGPGHSSNAEYSFPAYYVTDLGSCWTTPSNILGSAGYASASCTGSSNALFLPVDCGIQPGFGGSNTCDDIQISVGSAYASGSGGQISACITINHGQSCFTGSTMLNVSLPNGSGSAAAVVMPPTPSGTPTSGQFTYQPPFGPWGNPKITAEEYTSLSGTISVTNSTATLVSNLGIQQTGFPLSTVANNHILIAGSSSTCTSNDCMISALVNDNTLTLSANLGSFTGFSTTLNGGIAPGATTFTVTSATGFIRQLNGGSVSPYGYDKYAVSFQDSSPETVYCRTLSSSTFSNCTATSYAHSNSAAMGSTAFTMPNFGVMIWNSGSGTAYLQNATYTSAVSANFSVGDGTGANLCSVATVTVNYAADGMTPLSPAQIGRECQFLDIFGNPTLYLLIPATGEIRLLAFGNNTIGNGTTGTFNATNPDIQYYAGSGTVPQVYQCTYNSSVGKYATLIPNYTTAPTSPNYSCTSITSGTGNDLLSQIASVVGAGFNKTYFPVVSFGSLSGNYVGITVNGGQQSIGYSCWFNVALSAPNQITACTSSWAGAGQRWGGQHGLFNAKTAAGWGEIFNDPLNIQSSTGVGLYQLAINSISGETGTTALTANVATDPTTTTCPANPYGVTGHNCIQMIVATEPQNVAPSTGGASYATTSSSSVTIGTGSKTFTVASGLSWSAGHPVIAISGSNFMDGTVTSYSSTTLVINVTSVLGSGTYSSWTIDGGDTAMWPSSCTVGYAQLQGMQPGDNFIDGSSLFGEQFLILTKTGSGCSPITLVVARGQSQGCASAPVAHGTGGGGAWTPVMQATGQCDGNVYWFQESAPSVSYPDPPGIDGGHQFLGQSDGTGTNLIQYVAASYQGGIAYGARQGSLPSIIPTGFTYGMNEVYPFAGAGWPSLTYVQSHPSSQSYLANPPTLGYDGRPFGTAGGCAGLDCIVWYHTLTLQAGTTNTYLITCPAATPGGACIDTASPKTLGWTAWAGRFLLQDISGPGSVISDSTPYTFCYAYNAGECRSGSSAGNRYVSVPNADTGVNCFYHAPDRNAPCLAAAPPYAAQVTQYSWNQNDPNAALWRPLGYAFNGPGQTNNYWNWNGIVDGSWIFGDVSWKEGVRTDIVAIQLPPWPATDSVNRSTFVAVPVKLGGVSGVSFRIRFGYNPSLYCTSRQEVCATATSTGALPPQPGSAPFAYLSETQTWTACSTTCEIDIPGLSQHEMYYIVDRKNAAGLITSSLMQVVGVP